MKSWRNYFKGKKTSGSVSRRACSLSEFIVISNLARRLPQNFKKKLIH